MALKPESNFPMEINKVYIIIVSDTNLQTCFVPLSTTYIDLSLSIQD